jgi:hypothetical protein
MMIGTSVNYLIHLKINTKGKAIADPAFGADPPKV